MCINAIGKIYLCLRRPSLLESRAGIRMQTFKFFHFPGLFVCLFQMLAQFAYNDFWHFLNNMGKLLRYMLSLSCWYM